MSSRFETGLKSEALEALPEVVRLAQKVLSDEKYNEAEKIAVMILGSRRERSIAKGKLKLEIGNNPTRPLWYLWPLLDGLPRYTRDSIRYAGDYLDLLVKELTYEKLNGNARRRSLGANSKALSKLSDLKELSSFLEKYCNFLYNPGKHDFSLPLGRTHRFTSREVVLTIYITAELGKRILLISKNARDAVEDDDWYAIGGRWGSPERVYYYGKKTNDVQRALFSLLSIQHNKIHLFNFFKWLKSIVKFYHCIYSPSFSRVCPSESCAQSSSSWKVQVIIKWLVMNGYIPVRAREKRLGEAMIL